MKKNKNEKRLRYIDIAKGITILLMIVGHVVKNPTQLSTIFSFHMPLYIIVSGFCFKDKSFKDEIKTMFFKLYIPTTIVLLGVYFI